ncbi:hypothetical protein HHL28_16720 [Aerophototrophica crusticola]|uniref:Uncharacterized protein n=1 Tax=Aerophototrophica crusticola TaxID=1709002 RepID=A0A858RAS4_9PROT|nr:hypothetical protein HHL28_16720 [Rhodospirillaceae bacterium B3]
MADQQTIRQIHRRAFQPADPGPLDGTVVFGLSQGEQLLLWSARRWRHGRFCWDQVEAEYKRLAGPRWADALLAWEEALDLLHQLPSRTPEIRNGCDSRLSPAERALLTATAASLPGAGGDPSFLLARLAPPAARPELAAALSRVAASLEDCPLPLRGPAPVAADSERRVPAA